MSTDTRLPYGVRPGDFEVGSIGGLAGKGVWLGQRLNGAGEFAKYEHALLWTGIGYIQADPKGVTFRRDYPPGRKYSAWSTGKIRLTGEQRTAIVNAAFGYVGTDYSALDYFAIFAHHFHVPVPGLVDYIKDTGHMICSQLVDQCYKDGKADLFPGNIPGYVTPADLARLIA